MLGNPKNWVIFDGVQALLALQIYIARFLPLPTDNVLLFVNIN
jgi:hypothetical protein